MAQGQIEEFKKILKLQGISGKDISELLDIGYDSYRSMTRKEAKSVPKWVTAGIIFYNLGKDFKEKGKDIEVNKPEELS